MDNDSTGLNGIVNKKEQNDLLAQMENKKIDHSFFAAGMPFTKIEPASANHLFGQGKWKKEIRTHLGEEVLQAKADKYGNKPIDFKLAQVFIEPSMMKHFNRNENITLNVKAGDLKYNGAYKIYQRNNDSVIIIKEYLGNAQGVVVNNSKANGALAKMEAIAAKLKSTLTDTDPVKQAAQANPTLNAGPVKNEQVTIDEKQTDSKKAIKVIFGAAILITIAYGGYRWYQSRQAA